jgi:hypothetical protein
MNNVEHLIISRPRVIYTSPQPTVIYRNQPVIYTSPTVIHRNYIGLYIFFFILFIIIIISFFFRPIIYV